jgi:hypothetical protein
MPRRLSTIPLATIVASLLAAGCTAAGEQDATRSEDGEITENEDIGVFRLQAGDCLVMPAEGEMAEGVEALEATPCAEPHSGEVIALVNAPGGEDAPFPGDATLSDQAAEDCVSEFQTVTGRDFATDPDWDLTWLSPTPDSWTQGGDREIVCIAIPIDGSLVTTLVAG